MELPLISMEGLMPTHRDESFFQNEGSQVVTVPDFIFGLSPRDDLIHRMVIYQLAKRQAGTHFAKTRADVSRTGKKSVKQKGTGGARHGSRRVNIFRGGGKAFGPVVRSHAISLPKKVRALALLHALSAKAADGEVFVLDVEKMTLDSPKTKMASTIRERCVPEASAEANCIVFDHRDLDVNVQLASRNLRGLKVLSCDAVNVYDLTNCSRVIFTQSALRFIVQERFARLSKCKVHGEKECQ